MTPEPIEAISFDIWSTLLRGNPAFTLPRLRLIFDSLGFARLPDEQLQEAYMFADRCYNSAAEISGNDFGMAERLELMFARLNIEATLPDTETIRALQAKIGDLRLRDEYMPSLIEPDLPATLQQLQEQGLVLGLLSNTGMDNQQVMEPVLKKLGIWEYFQVAIFSSDDGRAKPNSRLFVDMAERLGAPPARVLHVGDNVVADYRAVEAGLQAIVFAPDGRKDNYPVIRSMKELVGQN